MAPPKHTMPFIIKQIKNLKRLNHGPKNITQLINSVNPQEYSIKNCVHFISYLVF